MEKMYHEVLHYLEIGRYPKAKELLTSLLRNDPQNNELLYLMAYSCFCLDQYSEAKEVCKEALINGFSTEKCNSLLGQIHNNLKEYPEAEKCFLEALRINPQNAPVMAAYSNLMLVTGHEEKAVALLQEALRLNPDDNVVLSFSFYHFLAKNKRQEQLKSLEQYMTVSNNEVNKLIKLGTVIFIKA